MKFGQTPVTLAAGHVLAHAVSTTGQRLQKGTLLSAADCQSLAAAGISTLWTAQLDDTDIGENEAARLIADAVSNNGVRAGNASTGRCNLYATHDGIVILNAAAAHNLNGQDEAITLATVAPFARVRAGQMVATLKIIPFAVHMNSVSAAIDAAREIALQVMPFAAKSAHLILTRVDGMKSSLFDKAEAITRARLAAVHALLANVDIVDHDHARVSAAIKTSQADITLILGGSAISDRADIIPAAIDSADGRILRLGMPVDPGNLLCLAEHADGRPILGLPGCARSPKLNGLDWVLDRIAANIPVSAEDIAAMGVGGLLDDLPDRGALRTTQDEKPETQPLIFGALILAAGRSSRMGDRNKLLLEDGRGPVVCQIADTLHAANVRDIIAVTGRDAEQITNALAPIRTVYNPDYAEGLSTSLKSGIAALPETWDAVIICLGDMPAIIPHTITALCTAAQQSCDAVVPIHDGKQGHPVIWKRAAFPLLMQAQGDLGGKAQLAALGERALKVVVDDPGVLLDIDTPEAWATYQRK